MTQAIIRSGAMMSHAYMNGAIESSVSMEHRVRAKDSTGAIISSWDQWDIDSELIIALVLLLALRLRSNSVIAV